MFLYGGPDVKLQLQSVDCRTVDLLELNTPDGRSQIRPRGAGSIIHSTVVHGAQSAWPPEESQVELSYVWNVMTSQGVSRYNTSFKEISVLL